MTRLLLDAGLARGVAADLRARGWDAVHVSDVGLGAGSDDAILAHAAGDGRVVVTLDRDMPRLLYLTRATVPSMLHVRIEGLDRGRATALIERVVPLVRDELSAGAIVAVTHAEVRVRRLPIG